MKTERISVDPHAEIEAQAAEFLQRRRFGNWSGTDSTELDAWLKAAHANRVAFLRLEAGLRRVERLAALRSTKRERKLRVPALRFFVPYIASATALSLVVVGGLMAARYFLRPADRTFSTDVGGHALIDFADGTQMALNTDTLLRVRMTSEERTVWLERGEAYFRVAHNAAHPFAVVVGRHRVADLGTEFAIRRNPDGLEVELVKGRAALISEGAHTATLTPGDDVVATATSMSVTQKTPQELADELAWRRGVIVLRHTRLDEAAREFNRYNRTKLVIADPAIAGMTIGGNFKTTNLEDFLRLTETVLDLRATREGDDILLSRASEKGTKFRRQE